MAEAEKTRTVDFIPEFGLDNDFKKITEYDFLQQNSIIVPLLTLINMDKGTNQLLPNMGLRDLLVSIPFSETSEVNSIISQINKQLQTYIHHTCSCDITSVKNTTDEALITFNISGLPSPLQIVVDKNSSTSRGFRVVNSSVFGMMSKQS